jgi:putative transposase
VAQHADEPRPLASAQTSTASQANARIEQGDLSASGVTSESRSLGYPKAGGRRKHPGFGDTFFIDEVFVKIAGQRHYLWRAVDQDGEVVDVYLQARRDAEAARRFFRRLLSSHGKSPWKIVTDKLGSYGVARRELMPAAIHDTGRYANNRAELSHQPTRARERGMRRFSSPAQAQRFLSAHAAVYSLFNLQRQLVSAAFYRFRRTRAFECWNEAVAA